MFNARLYGFWGSLIEALHTGEPQNEAKEGGDLFTNLYADPDRLEGFLRGMTGITSPAPKRLSVRFHGTRYRACSTLGQRKAACRSVWLCRSSEPRITAWT
jgi:hypothetical protein